MWSPTQVIQGLGTATTLVVAARQLVDSLTKLAASRNFGEGELLIEKTPAF